MSKRMLIGLAVALCVAVAGWSLAQSGPGVPKKVEGARGRFSAAPMGESAVLVEGATGRTWVYHTSADGRTGAWLPAKRLDDVAAAREWLDLQEKMRKVQGTVPDAEKRR